MLETGESSTHCGCYRWTDWNVVRSVRIDVDALLLEREQEREEAELLAAQRKSNTPSERAAGPSNPRKRKAEDNDTSIDSISTNASKPKSKSRKMKVKREGNDSALATASSSSTGSSSQKSPMKITLRLAAPDPIPKELEPFPCCLCVSRSEDDLLPVQDAPLGWTGVPIQALPKDENGKLIWKAHESCAMTIPETWVDEVEGADGEQKKVVFGVDAIVKDRWHLVCRLFSRFVRGWSDIVL